MKFMENMIDFINKFAPKISLRDDISGRLKIFHNLKKEDSNKSKDYFNLVDTTLPADIFVDMKFKKEKSQELKNILAQGNKIHSIAQNWLQQHAHYLGSEAILDGILIGLPIRGKIDGRIRESIIEIKSIKDLPEKSEDIINEYPQYIEQLAFYSIIDPLAPKENYLIFIERNYPYTTKSFKLSILNPKAIKNILHKRIYLLKEVISNKKSPKTLGRCRYCYEEDCNVKKEGNCHLLNLEPLACEIKDYVTLVEAQDLNSELEHLKKTYGNNYEFYSAYNLLCPRKYCFKKLYNFEENFENKYYTAKAYFGNLIYRFKKNEDEDFLKEKVKSEFSEFRLNKYNWLNDKTSLSPEGKDTPFITHVTDYFNPTRPSSYKIAELGLYLMAHNLTKGIIFIFYPEKNHINAFEITFDFKENYIAMLRKIIKTLKNPENLSSLPKCPDWMCDKCVYFKKCSEIPAK